MDVKHKEVQQWLESVFGCAAAVPAYETSNSSIEVLHQLMTNAREAEKNAKVLTEDCLVKADEYRAKGAQLSAAMQTVGWSSTCLPQPAQNDLANIANAACAVEAATASESNIVLAYNRLETEHDKVTRECRSDARLRAQLLASSQQLAGKMEHLKSLEAQAAAAEAAEEAQVAANRRRELFHELKLAEYAKDITAREAELQQRSYTESLSHHNVTKEWRDLQALQRKVSTLQKQLAAYSLPPDVAASRLIVEETRHRLDTLMTQMTADTVVHN